MNDSIPLELPSVPKYCNTIGCIVNSTVELSMDVSFTVYLIAMVGFVGWIVFSVYTAVGLVTLPMELIQSFMNRPMYMSKAVYIESRRLLDERLGELFDVGHRLEDDISNAYVVFPFDV